MNVDFCLLRHRRAMVDQVYGRQMENSVWALHVWEVL